jgi:hypothetical protein
MSADGKPTRGRTRSLTDSARKRNRREVLENYNKARINKGQKEAKSIPVTHKYMTAHLPYLLQALQ